MISGHYRIGLIEKASGGSQDSAMSSTTTNDDADYEI